MTFEGRSVYEYPMKVYAKNHKFNFKILSEIIDDIIKTFDINFRNRNYKNLNEVTIYNLIDNLPDDDIVEFFDTYLLCHSSLGFPDVQEVNLYVRLRFAQNHFLKGEKQHPDLSFSIFHAVALLSSALTDIWKKAAHQWVLEDLLHLPSNFEDISLDAKDYVVYYSVCRNYGISPSDLSLF